MVKFLLPEIKDTDTGIVLQNEYQQQQLAVYYIVSAARSLTCRDDLDSKWRLLLAENELSRVSLLFRISIGNFIVLLV